MSFFSMRHRRSVQLLADATILRIMPLRIRGFLVRKFGTLYHVSAQNNSEGLKDNFTFYHAIQKGIELGESKNVFKYYHLHGVHHNYIMDENCNPDYSGSGTSRDEYIRQGKGCLKMTSLFLEQLKEQGIYDGSLIIIAGDHGRHENFFGLTELPLGMNPLFLVKLPYENHESMVKNDEILPQTEVAPALIAAVEKNAQGNTPFFLPSESEKPSFKERWDKIYYSADNNWTRQKVILSPSQNEKIPDLNHFEKEVPYNLVHEGQLNQSVIGFTVIPTKPRDETVYVYLEDATGNRIGGESLKIFPYKKVFSCCYEISCSPDLPDGEYTLLFRYQLEDGWVYSKFPKTLIKQGEKLMYSTQTP
ncbi:MAG: hypothetical protein Q4C96_11695 [Planctomycetia bacterium]|nr:hypothetical protein [Planctomycetia bacterium]